MMINNTSLHESIVMLTSKVLFIFLYVYSFYTTRTSIIAVCLTLSSISTTWGIFVLERKEVTGYTLSCIPPGGRQHCCVL